MENISSWKFQQQEQQQHYLLVHLRFLCQWDLKINKQGYYMSLEAEVIKGFLVSLQVLCFYGDLRDKSY